MLTFSAALAGADARPLANPTAAAQAKLSAVFLIIASVFLDSIFVLTLLLRLLWLRCSDSSRCFGMWPHRVIVGEQGSGTAGVQKQNLVRWLEEALPGQADQPG